MYGADAAAHAGAAAHHAPAAVPRRLDARARLADRVPGRRLRRRRVHRELPAARSCALDAQRQGRSGGTTRRREDGLVARDRRRRARRARDGRASSACSTGATAGCAGRRPRRLADRVVADRARRHRLLRRLERPRLRARPRARGGCAGCYRGRLQDHLERRDRRRGRSTSATTAAACSRSRSRSGQRALVALASTAASTGRPRSRPAASSCPRRPAARLTAFSTRGRYLWRVGTGRYVYSSPAVWAGRVFFGSYNGRLYAVSATSGPRPLDGRARAGRSRARRRRRRRRLRGLDARAASSAPTRSSGRVAAPLPARRVRPGLRQRPPAAPARLLARSTRSTRSGDEEARSRRSPRCVLLGAGVVVGYVVYKRDQAADVRGSSTEEFVTTEEAAPPPRRRGAPASSGRCTATTPSATRVAAYRAPPAVPPRLDVPRAAAARVPARDRLRPPLLHEQPGGSSPSTRRPASGRGRSDSGRCVAASPAVWRAHSSIQTFLNRPTLQPQGEAGAARGRVVIAFATGFGQIRWRTRIGAERVVAAASSTGVVYVGDWRGRVYALDAAHRQGALDVPGRRARSRAASRCSGNRLYVGSYDHHLYALDARAPAS